MASVGGAFFAACFLTKCIDSVFLLLGLLLLSSNVGSKLLAIDIIVFFLDEGAVFAVFNTGVGPSCSNTVGGVE